MHHQYLNEPMILDVAQTSSLIITLPSNMSDFIVLETMGAPGFIIEWGLPLNLLPKSFGQEF